MAKKLFNDYTVECHGMLVGFVWDDRLFLKFTPEGMSHMGDFTLKRPFPGAKPCLVVPRECWSDELWLMELVKKTLAGLAPQKRA
jgi:TfoX/Sxy family transcriptional regulator of competence genes